MPTDDIAHQRILYVTLSCGCVIGFRCKPTVGDELICVRHDSPVRVINPLYQDAEEIA